MSIRYECNECGWKYDWLGSTTEENICPNCRSNDIEISPKEYASTSTNDIKLTPVRTLIEWFTELPLLYKLDLYNSMLSTITKHLK